MGLDIYPEKEMQLQGRKEVEFSRQDIKPIRKGSNSTLSNKK